MLRRFSETILWGFGGDLLRLAWAVRVEGIKGLEFIAGKLSI